MLGEPTSSRGLSTSILAPVSEGRVLGEALERSFVPRKATTALARQNPDPHISVGHRLMRVYSACEGLVSDPWTLSIVRRGYQIPLLSSPPLLTCPPYSRLPGGVDRTESVLQEVEALLKGRNHPLTGRVFYRLLFPRISRGEKLRRMAPSSRFEQAKITWEKQAIPHGRTGYGTSRGAQRGLVASIDLMDAYRQIPIHRQSTFDQVIIQDKVYRFTVLPFDLCNAPYASRNTSSGRTGVTPVVSPFFELRRLASAQYRRQSYQSTAC